MDARSLAFAARGRGRRHPRRRSDADADAGLPHHRAAAGVRPVRAVPHRGGLALRRARTGLVLEQHLPSASTPARISTRRSTGSPARTCRTTRSTRIPAREIHRAGLRDRLLGAGGRRRGFPADDRRRRGLGKAARPDSGPAAGCCCAPTGRRGATATTPTARRRRAHAGPERRGGALPGRGARRARLRHRDDRHRCRPGPSPQPALSGALSTCTARAATACSA